MIYLQIDDRLKKTDAITPALSDLLEQTAQLTLEHVCDQPQADVTLVLSDDTQLQALNLAYLGIDSPTDVLSFPGGEIDPDTDDFYLGDVVISYMRAISQARAGDHPVEAELQLLVVHGVLHLCGYDHAFPQEKAEMWRLQAEVLALLNCPILGPSAESEA